MDAVTPTPQQQTPEAMFAALRAAFFSGTVQDCAFISTYQPLPALRLAVTAAATATPPAVDHAPPT